MCEIHRCSPTVPWLRQVSLSILTQTKPPSFAVPRQPSNDLFEIFEIERGVSADDEAKDDPGRYLHFYYVMMIFYCFLPFPESEF